MKKNNTNPDHKEKTKRSIFNTKTKSQGNKGKGTKNTIVSL